MALYKFLTSKKSDFFYTGIPSGMLQRSPAAFYLFFIIILSSCAIRIIKDPPPQKPFIIENTFEVKGGNFTKLEKEAVKARMATQVDDSAQVKIKSPLFFLDIIKKPLAWDSGYAGISARNMVASMYALGHFDATADFDADTTDVKKVKVKYTLNAGPQTLIDTLIYKLGDTAIQQLALQYSDKTLLQENKPFTKAGVLGEINRLVDTLRNNGYYKFTAAELRMRGDTTIAALTQLSNDPFEQLALLAEAQSKRDSPTIRLQMVINKPDDPSKLEKYTINKVYVLQDFRPGDKITDTTTIQERKSRLGNLTLRFHERYIRTPYLLRNILLRPGDFYNQNNYYSTITNLSRAGIWQSVNIKTEEVDSNKLNMILELIPGKKFGFETSLEVSYSSTSVSSNPLGSDLLGIAGNVSLTNRNIGKQAVKMTHALRAGIELNSGNGRSKGSSIINSDEFTYTNSVLFPGRVSLLPIKFLRTKTAESFINSRVSLVNRFALFDLSSFSINFGTVFNLAPNQKLTIRPFNAELNYLNKSDSFKNIIAVNPFLRYSYTTSFILGTSASYQSLYANPKHLLSLSKERSFKTNVEESGLTIGALPILKKYKSNFIKADAEYKYTVNYAKTALVFRAFTGVGVPLFGDSSLPFFKQYFGGGSNSMRAWPIRGIGRGSQKLAPFGTLFNDRTGDLQFETNLEYRYDIARIIPNTLTLRGAVFTDIGNIWNLKNSTPGFVDPAQFKFKNFYKELGVDVGTGFRLDFNYVVIRIDLGFRIKRPELSDVNDGWKLPPLHFTDVFQKLFTRGTNDENRKWRYENFNLTFGISYPF